MMRFSIHWYRIIPNKPETSAREPGPLADTATKATGKLPVATNHESPFRSAPRRGRVLRRGRAARRPAAARPARGGPRGGGGQPQLRLAPLGRSHRHAPQRGGAPLPPAAEVAR